MVLTMHSLSTRGRPHDTVGLSLSCLQVRGVCIGRLAKLAMPFIYYFLNWPRLWAFQAQTRVMTIGCSELLA